MIYKAPKSQKEFGRIGWRTYWCHKWAYKMDLWIFKIWPNFSNIWIPCHSGYSIP